MVRGGATVISGVEVAILGTTLRLLATLTPERRDAALTLGNEDCEIRVAIAMPPVSS